MSWRNSHVEFVDSKEGNQFTARIFRPVIDDNTDDKLPINPSSGDKLNRVYGYVKEHPHTTSDGVACFMGFSQESAKKYLQQLVAANLVVAEGGNRNRTYSK